MTVHYPAENPLFIVRESHVLKWVVKKYCHKILGCKRFRLRINTASKLKFLNSSLKFKLWKEKKNCPFSHKVSDYLRHGVPVNTCISGRSLLHGTQTSRSLSFLYFFRQCERKAALPIHLFNHIIERRTVIVTLTLLRKKYCRYNFDKP
jgi:hypothetical protein